MKVIFIYGPIATGKLTVASELAKITDHKVFHNHLAVDLVNVVHDFGTERFFELIDKYRLELIEDAAKHKKVNGLILTFVYTKSASDDKFVKEIIKIAKEHKSDVHFVRLHTDKETLLKRVESESRQKHGKLKDPVKLLQVMSEWDMMAPITFVDSLDIDNTNSSPKEVALKIKEHFKL